MTNNDTITFISFDQTFEVTPTFSRYANGNRIAISFYDEDGPFAHLTTNLPDQHLNQGEIFVKDWHENEALVEALLKAGWLELTGREVQSGHVFPKVMRLSGRLLQLAERVRPI
jgi:hypothetical protein